MAWIHDVPEDDLYDHEGYGVAVLADGSEPDPLQFPNPGQEGVTIGNNAWWLYTGKEGRPLAVAVRAGCACGWRSQNTFPVDFDDHKTTEGYEHSDGPFGAWQHEHIASLLGTTMPHELTAALNEVTRLITQLASERPLAALTAIGRLGRLVESQAPRIGATARRRGATWEAIGKAIGATRQAAFQRFARHVR